MRVGLTTTPKWMTLSDLECRNPFLASTSWIRAFECQKIIQPNLCNSMVFCALHDQLSSLGRHAQLTRCFSAVAELLVIYLNTSNTDPNYAQEALKVVSAHSCWQWQPDVVNVICSTFQQNTNPCSSCIRTSTGDVCDVCEMQTWEICADDAPAGPPRSPSTSRALHIVR